GAGVHAQQRSDLRRAPRVSGAPAAVDGPERAVVDGHVHAHPGFRLEEVLDAGARALARAARDAPAARALLLAGTEGRGGLEPFRRASRERRGAWQIRETAEAESLRAERGPDV